MLPFFNKKNKNNPKLEGEESIFSSEDIIKNSSSELHETETEIETELSIHPSWNLPKEDIYSFQFLNQECPPLKPNQLSLYGVNLMKNDSEEFLFSAFIRHSLDKSIKLEEATIVLLGKDDEILGRKSFDLSKVGELPPKSSRPWTFAFINKDLFTDEIPVKGWKLAFQLKPTSRKHSLELSDSWKQSLATEDQEKLEKMVENMDPPKPGEVNFLGLQAKMVEATGELHVTLLIRNGGEKNINLEQIPLQVEDATGELVAKGGFKMDPKLQVASNTSKPWNFVFPKTMISKDAPDLSKWKAYPPKEASKN